MKPKKGKASNKKNLETQVELCEKLQQVLATKIFQFDPKNENLDFLLKLDILDLFSKYEVISMQNNSEVMKNEETIQTLSEVKIKLKLQTEQKELYEEQHQKIMNVLNIPEENRSFTSILPAIENLKKCLCQMEVEHYSHANSVVESFLK